MLHEENWKIGANSSVVVSDTKVEFNNFRAHDNEEDIKYYGGYLVCESIASKAHAELIAEAPAMLRSINSLLAHATNWINENHPDHKEAKRLIEKLA